MTVYCSAVAGRPSVFRSRRSDTTRRERSVQVDHPEQVRELALAQVDLRAEQLPLRIEHLQ